MDIYMDVPESNPGLQAWVASILSTNPSTWILQVKKNQKTYDNDIPTSSNHMKSRESVTLLTHAHVTDSNMFSWELPLSLVMVIQWEEKCQDINRPE